MKTETELREYLKYLTDKKARIKKLYDNMNHSTFGAGTLFSTHLKTINKLTMQIQTLKWVLSDNKQL